MTSRILKILAIIAITSLVAGCKLAVIVPSGGDVTSASGTKNCTGGSLCEHNIKDSTFNESFTAVAKPGYVFTKWNKGDGFLCGDSTNPTCTISNVGTAGIAAIEAVIATGQFFYAMPLFDFVGIDTDGDGIKDHLDVDDDNDGVLDGDDACPLVGPNVTGFGCPVGAINERVSRRAGYFWVLANYLAPKTEHNNVCAEFGYVATPYEVTLTWDATLLSSLSADFGYESNGDDADAAKAMWCWDERSPWNTPPGHCDTHNFGDTYVNYGAVGEGRPVFTCMEAP